MKLTLAYPPSSNAYWRMWRGRILVSAVARAYKLSVRQRALVARLKPLAGEVSIDVVAFRPALRGDLDNLLKVTLDALQGVAFVNDDQVAEIHARRELDRTNPRLEITVEACEP